MRTVHDSWVSVHDGCATYMEDWSYSSSKMDFIDWRFLKGLVATLAPIKLRISEILLFLGEIAMFFLVTFVKIGKWF